MAGMIPTVRLTCKSYSSTKISILMKFLRLVFRWLFIPFLQSELDAWVDRVNNTKKRADRNKILPHGVPNDIYGDPERFGCLDFKV